MSMRPESPRLESTRPETSGVLIFGGDLAALAVLRSLGRRGVPVCYAGPRQSPARWSRFCSRFVLLAADAPDIVERLMDLAEREALKGWRLLPCGDAEVEIVSRAYERLARAYRVAVPRWETLRYACDDHLMVQRARGLAIAHPLIHPVRSAEEAVSAPLAFPVVAKAARAAGRAALPEGARLIADRPALVTLFATLPPGVTAADIAIHDWIPGEGDVHLSYAALWRRGSPVVSLVALRTRQGPHGLAAEPSFVEYVEVEEVAALARRFLRAMSYEGFVEVRFKYDARDGQYRITGVLPRPWSWMTLAEGLGIDLPWLFWTDEPEAALVPRPGLSWRDGWFDARLLGHRVLRLQASPRSATRRIAQASAAWARDDRKPALAHALLRMPRQWPVNPATTIAPSAGAAPATPSADTASAPTSAEEAASPQGNAAS